MPNSTRHSPDVVLMLGQRQRRWTNIETKLSECLVFAGCVLARIFHTHIPPYSCPHDSYTGGIGVGLWCCLVVRVSELANYQACVLTGHSISGSEMTISFCQAF